jgi:hypothetical protein
MRADQADGADHRAGTAGTRDMKGSGHHPGHVRGIVDLDDPFGDAAEKLTVVELLAGFAPARVASDLSD